MNIREKEKPDRKKMNSALQHVRTDFRCMIGEERLDSFMTEDPIINKPDHRFPEQISGLVSIRPRPPS